MMRVSNTRVKCYWCIFHFDFDFVLFEFKSKPGPETGTGLFGVDAIAISDIVRVPDFFPFTSWTFFGF